VRRETIGSLGLRVKDLVMKAYPKLDADMRQELAIAPFIRALNDPQLEQAIWATTPATLQRAMEVALACENGMRVAVSGRGSRSQGATVRIHRIEEGVSGEEMQDENGVANLVASVRALSQQDVRGSRPPVPVGHNESSNQTRYTTGSKLLAFDVLRFGGAHRAGQKPETLST
jgi:hypothetical protein